MFLLDRIHNNIGGSKRWITELNSDTLHVSKNNHPKSVYLFRSVAEFVNTFQLLQVKYLSCFQSGKNWRVAYRTNNRHTPNKLA